MYLVSIYESDKSLNFQTVESLNDLYRGLCNGLDVNKFNSYSNFNLLVCNCNIPSDIHCLLSDLNKDNQNHASYSFFESTNENLADSIYDYMQDNINVYFDIVKQIDDFREKIINYKLDK